MAIEGESGPDPAVCIAISPLRRADFAIESPASDLFALCGRTPARAAYTRPVEQSGCYWIGRRHGGKGASRSPSIRRGISTNGVLGMATSAIWKVMQRPWRTTLAPIFTSFS